MAEIIEFPKGRIIREQVEDSEVVKLAKERGTQYYADTVFESIMADIDEQCQVNGLDSDTIEFQKDYQYLAETVKSMVYRAIQLKHPMQDMVLEAVKLVDAGE